MLQHQIMPAPQQIAAFLRKRRALSRQGRLGGGYGVRCFVGAVVCDSRHHAAIRGIYDVKRRAVCGRTPVPTHIA